MAPDLEMDLGAIYVMLLRPQTHIFFFLPYFPFAASLFISTQITCHIVPTPMWQVLGWVHRGHHRGEEAVVRPTRPTGWW